MANKQRNKDQWGNVEQCWYMNNDTHRRKPWWCCWNESQQMQCGLVVANDDKTEIKLDLMKLKYIYNIPDWRPDQ